MTKEELETQREQFKRAYEIQKQAREEAELLLEEKSRELYLKNKSLEDALDKLSKQQVQLVMHEKLASVGQLGAGLAHELNNPNAFVKNNIHTLDDYVNQLVKGLNQALQILEQANRDQLPIASRETIEEIKTLSDIEYIEKDIAPLIAESLEGSARISHIANGLRYFADPDLSQKRPMDVEECIRQSKQLLQGSEQLGLIELHLKECPAMSGLPMLMSQAFANLLSNAMDANAHQAPITVRTESNAQQLIISIQDQGIGMSQEVLDQACTPFFSTKVGHNGLGLGICQSILQQHNGSMTIESEPDRGTTVTICLPIEA